MKKKLLIGVAISGLFLYLALRGIDWSAFADAFRGANYWWLIPGVVFTMLGHYSRAWRWKTMVDPIKRVGIGPLWSATAIAFMVNNLFPARLGEFVRAWAIGRAENVSKSAAFATIVFERVVDVFVLIILLWVCLLSIEGPEWLPRSAAIIIAFNVVLLVLLFLMVRRKEWFRRVVEVITRPLPEKPRERVVWASEAFVDGLGVITNVRAAFPISLGSVAVWGFATLGVWACLPALHMDLPPMASVLLIVIISLGSMIPSAPAFLGTMQYACVVGLEFYGVDRSAALAYAIVYHATQFFPITIAGLYYAARSSIRLSDISSRRDA